MLFLNQKILQPNVDNKVIWGDGKNGKFSVNSMFKVLIDSRKIQLEPKMQPKICFFASEAAWRRALTIDQNKTRGRHLANRRPLCQKDEETIDYLLLYCAVAWIFCILLVFRVLWVFPRSIRQALES